MAGAECGEFHGLNDGPREPVIVTSDGEIVSIGANDLVIIGSGGASVHPVVSVVLDSLKRRPRITNNPLDHAVRAANTRWAFGDLPGEEPDA